jgi:L-lactate utilization protein LutC
VTAGAVPRNDANWPTRAPNAIAQTGTIVLDGSPDQGQRAISPVPG